MARPHRGQVFSRSSFMSNNHAPTLQGERADNQDAADQAKVFKGTHRNPFHARDGSRTDVVRGGRSLRSELTMNRHHADAGETCPFPAQEDYRGWSRVIDERYFLAANGTRIAIFV
ncbi:hypothetical protein [Nitrobacter sp.]|uniref:hypothetical protein n=1 Tax=Nitrobacter sp. TaxID=29420 RepID=UPI003F649729